MFPPLHSLIFTFIFGVVFWLSACGQPLPTPAPITRTSPATIAEIEEHFGAQGFTFRDEETYWNNGARRFGQSRELYNPNPPLP